MPIHNQLSPLLKRLWNNVWARLPEDDRRYFEQLNRDIVVEQFEDERDYLGCVCWRENTLVILLYAQMQDGPRGRYIIAHELAHLRLHHPWIGWGGIFPGWKETVEADLYESWELLADVQVLHWDFKQELIAAAESKKIRHPQFLKWLNDNPPQ